MNRSYPSTITVVRDSSTRDSSKPAAPLRIGIVGRAVWGENIYAALQSLGVEIAWHAGRDWPHVQLPVDGVAIAVEPKALPELTAWWLGAGSPIFVEKPVTMEPMFARRLPTLNCEKVPVLVDYTGLWHKDWDEFREVVLRAQGATGLIAECTKPEITARSCGILWDFGPHAAAEILDIWPDAQLVKAHQARYSGPTGIVGFFVSQGRHAGLIAGRNVGKKAHRVVAASESFGSALVFDAHAPCDPPPLTRALSAWLDAIRLWRAGGWDEAKADRRFGFDLTIKVTELLAHMDRVIARGAVHA